MSAIHDSFSAFARDIGISPARLAASRLDIAADPGKVVGTIASTFERLDHRHGDGKSRRDAAWRRDAATAFLTSSLAQVLTPMERVGREEFLFVPGRTGDMAPLLPVIRKVELGKNTCERTVIAHTGEARFFGPGGTRGLRRTDTAEDQKSVPVGYFGVRFGWDAFELWQASHLGRDVPAESQRGAVNVMDDLFEETAGMGQPERDIAGFFTGGVALTFDLSKSFGDPTLTYAELLEQLGIIDVMWHRANPRRGISGIVMPRTHRVNMLKIFNGDGNQGAPMWEYATKMYKWLANIIEDDRLLTASDTGASMWQLYSADSDELYLEGSPGHMLFGPFETELETEFILMNMTAGAVNWRAERIMRVQFPT